MPKPNKPRAYVTNPLCKTAQPPTRIHIEQQHDGRVHVIVLTPRQLKALLAQLNTFSGTYGRADR